MRGGGKPLTPPATLTAVGIGGLRAGRGFPGGDPRTELQWPLSLVLLHVKVGLRWHHVWERGREAGAILGTASWLGFTLLL